MSIVISLAEEEVTEMLNQFIQKKLTRIALNVLPFTALI